MLSTSTANSCAIDLLLNFTGRNAGTISFDVATVFNGSGNRDSRLKLFYSTDGTTFTELTGTNLPYTARNNVASSVSITSIALPAAFNNSATARLRFYEHSTTAGGLPSATGSQPKISIDNISVTSTSATVTPTLIAGTGTVDADFDITFSDDPTWRAAVTAVKYGTPTLNSGTDYSFAAGILTLKPTGGNAALHAAGTETVTVIATGYTDATVSQPIGAGADNKLAMNVQPTAPATNGGALATQPSVFIQDQYNNPTSSTAVITANTGSGSWTPTGSTTATGVSGTATFSGLTATSAAAVVGATISFTSPGLTAVSSGTFNIPAPAGLPTPTLIAASATVDADFDITFSDDASWRSAVTIVTYGLSVLTVGTDYSFAAGILTLKPSGGNPSLQIAGTEIVTVSATGYDDATVSQTIGAGADFQLAMDIQPTDPAVNGGALAVQPSVFIQDQYGNATSSTAIVTANTGSGTWTPGGSTTATGISGTATFSGLTATSASSVTGATINFTSPGLVAVSSGTFNIPAPSADHIAFVSTPTDRCKYYCIPRCYCCI
ncbi:MAG: hypothetical protein IPH33_09765 [Bacteroidetes bacterium]|nr:hypothetical protein [Bacteroidota bacterium]